MDQRICKKCNTAKSYADFYWNSRDKIYESQCKDCKSTKYKQRYASDPQLFLKRNKRWAENNPEKRNAQIKRWSDSHPEAVAKSIKKYRDNHPQRQLEATYRWQRNHPKKFKEVTKRLNTKRYNSPRGKLSSHMSSGIRNSLFYGAKSRQHWEELVDYTVDQLKEHLERLFTPEMSWENYGKYWEIDHKIPLSAFNFEHPEDIDFRRCWTLKNLQPLEASENVRKHAKVDRPFQPALLITSFVGGVASERMRKNDPPKDL